MPVKWCHGDDIGQVVALRSKDAKLFAVVECELTPAELEALTAEYGALRWSPGTRRFHRGPLTITKCSLTPRPASVGLHPVPWHRHGVSKGNVPAWVVADLKRGRHDALTRHGTIDVYERTGHWLATEQEAADAYMRQRQDRFRHEPREMCFSAGGRILAVDERPPRG